MHTLQVSKVETVPELEADLVMLLSGSSKRHNINDVTNYSDLITSTV